MLGPQVIEKVIAKGITSIAHRAFELLPRVALFEVELQRLLPQTDLSAIGTLDSSGFCHRVEVIRKTCGRIMQFKIRSTIK